jgi:acetyl-CoA acetyltransferase
MASGKLNTDGEETITQSLGPKAFEVAGIGPEDIDLIEVHDATSPSEIITLIQLGLCPGEKAAEWIDNGYLDVDGKLPTNTSGGLVAKGHPIGATGCSQVYEIVNQLRERAGKRQVKDPKVGMMHNGGGVIGTDAAAMAIHILKK